MTLVLRLSTCSAKCAIHGQPIGKTLIPRTALIEGEQRLEVAGIEIGRQARDALRPRRVGRCLRRSVERRERVLAGAIRPLGKLRHDECKLLCQLGSRHQVFDNLDRADVEQDRDDRCDRVEADASCNPELLRRRVHLRVVPRCNGSLDLIRIAVGAEDIRHGKTQALLQRAFVQRKNGVGQGADGVIARVVRLDRCRQGDRKVIRVDVGEVAHLLAGARDARMAIDAIEDAILVGVVLQHATDTATQAA